MNRSILLLIRISTCCHLPSSLWNIELTFVRTLHSSSCRGGILRTVVDYNDQWRLTGVQDKPVNSLSHSNIQAFVVYMQYNHILRKAQRKVRV